MTRKDGLPRRVYLKHGRYWHVGADGKWRSLARERDGLPAMLRALAALQEGEVIGVMGADAAWREVSRRMPRMLSIRRMDA